MKERHNDDNKLKFEKSRRFDEKYIDERLYPWKYATITTIKDIDKHLLSSAECVYYDRKLERVTFVW